ncbi:hypothetical protein ACFO25_06360 [Paenactinomyces guangxiensis]|uniref:EthD domain-containing protein n=1 Tax=Paenactinomyces guangxiensis TaxID=1490290 RepID=A0A7W2A800_9BACL|nr:hypothetical protein [Paenactinomyces guangxiensis]MBA4493323.1 hypothetical protein [Paenactinomyces guangxiensis]MBH8589826.1 hypothetical protein [Paenactinomyces guangxiensis]
MFKTMGIYKRMKNIQEFQRFYVSEFMPRMLQLPGVLEMKINSLTTAESANDAEDHFEIDLIVETYYESAETIKQLMATEEGRSLGNWLVSKGEGKVGAFVAQEYRVQSYRSAQGNFKTIGICKKTDQTDEFEKFYISEFMPQMMKMPGVVKMEINKLLPTQLANQAEDLHDIDFVIETYYESPETMKQIMATEEGKALGDSLISRVQGNMGIYVAKEYQVQSFKRLEEKR